MLPRPTEYLMSRKHRSFFVVSAQLRFEYTPACDVRLAYDVVVTEADRAKPDDAVLADTGALDKALIEMRLVKPHTGLLAPVRRALSRRRHVSGPTGEKYRMYMLGTAQNPG